MRTRVVAGVLGGAIASIALIVFGGCASLSGGVVTASPETYEPPHLSAGADQVVMVPAIPELGFHTEYFLFVPAGVPRGQETRLLVQPNNTGRVSDSHAVHRDRAERDAEQGIGHYLARELTVPLLVPAFDRPESIGMTYTHALDRDTLEITGGRYGRIDLQLIAMIDHATTLLFAADVPIEEGVWMVGFSASANFANRFAALHPQEVRAVATGGVNGMPIVPAEVWNGRIVPYHVGVGDIAELIGRRFDGCAYRSVSQFIFMGESDDNDTLPYGDAYSEEERRITRELLGDSMAERWARSREIYAELDVPAQFVTYRGVGHEMNEAIRTDIVRFLRANDERGFAPIEPSGATAEGLAER
ncbi:MAG: hypothetical protein PF508_19215 [Spirochaeta sp.]|nr:hypothetical protein [Spirochaeta sp.]